MLKDITTEVREGINTIHDALEFGGLNWKVEKKGIYNELGQRIPNHYRTARSDNNDTLGIVGNQYEVYQNDEALSFIDNLLGIGLTKLNRIGSFSMGRRIVANIQIKDDEGGSEVDPIEKNMVITNSHDGSSPVLVLCTDTRVVCQNTLELAIREAKNKFSVKHTRSMREKMHIAEDIFAKSIKYFQETNNFYNHLKDVTFTEKQLRELVGRVYGFDATDKDLSTRSDNILEEVTELSYTGKGTDLPNVRGTAWGAYNAVTEYLDHYSTNRVHEGRNASDVKFESIYFGSIAQKRHKLANEIREMVAIG